MKYDPVMKQKKPLLWAAMLITENVSAHAIRLHSQQTEDVQNHFMVWRSKQWLCGGCEGTRGPLAGSLGRGHVHTPRVTRLHSKGPCAHLCRWLLSTKVAIGTAGLKQIWEFGESDLSPFTLIPPEMLWGITSARWYQDVQCPRHLAPPLDTAWNDFQPWAQIPLPKPCPDQSPPVKGPCRKVTQNTAHPRSPGPARCST